MEMRKYNGPTNINNIDNIKQMYDAIHEESSSYRESLLVSPHCSKYDRQSFKNTDSDPNFQDNSLLEYIQPQEEKYNRTKIKEKQNQQVRKERNNNFKKTEPDEYEGFVHRENHHKLNACISELQAEIREKDERIVELEKTLAKNNNKSINFPTMNTVFGTPQLEKSYNFNASKDFDLTGMRWDKRNKEEKAENKENYYLESQIDNYKKEIRFLTHNNQEMYEELANMTESYHKQKKLLDGTILYNQELELRVSKINRRVLELEELNNELLQEKKEMMDNYEDEMKLFQKMTNIYKSTQTNQNSQKELNLKSIDLSKRKESNVKQNDEGKKCQSTRGPNFKRPY